MENYVANNHGGDDEHGEPGGPIKIDLKTMQILLFTALLCSSDVVAAVSIVNYEA